MKSLVFGSSGSIGSAIVGELISSKHGVLAIARSSDNSTDLRKKYGVSGNAFEFLEIGDDEFYSETLIEEKLSKYEKFDNAYICIGEYYSGSFYGGDLEDYLGNIRANLIIPMVIIKAIVGSLCDEANIVVLNSVASKRPSKEEGAYGVSKGALTKFLDSIELESRAKKINIVNVIFGATKSRMTLGRSSYDKLIEPHELAKLILVNMESYSTLRIKSIEIERKIPN